MLKSAVTTASRLVDRVAPAPSGVTILIYHRVGGGSSSAVDLDPAQFDEQLALLANEFRVITLGAALDELAVAPSSTAASRPGVVLTFDDGTADFTDIAVPLLARHGLPATLYAATEFIDTGDEFPWGAPPTSWSALRDAQSTGLIDVGSHTHTHRLLDRLEGSRVADDLQRSIELIADNVGTSPHDFAYPKAVPGSPAAEIEVRKRFRSAALASNRVNRGGHTDVHRLGRTPIQTSDTSDRFRAKARGGMRLEGELRSTAARLRYRRATR